MAILDDDLAQHLAAMHGALSVKADLSLEDITYRWLLSDTLFSLSLDQSWDAVADADRAALDATLAGRT